MDKKQLTKKHSGNDVNIRTPQRETKRATMTN